MAGFGTVVTGTLLDGNFRSGDEVLLLPKEIQGRVRGIQTHKEKIEQATPGSRVAINLTGVEVREIERGDVLCLPGDYSATRLVDVHFKLLPDSVTSLKHDQKVKLYVGASQTFARVRLLGRDVVQPGESAWLQLELRHPIVVARGDHYILRRPSPGATLGGGKVIDPRPKGFYRRKDQHHIERLMAFTSGDPKAVIVNTLSHLGPIKVRELDYRSQLRPDEFSTALEDLMEEGKIYLLEQKKELADSVVLGDLSVHRIQKKALAVLADYHREFPLRIGMPKEELKSRLELQSKEFNATIPFLNGIVATPDGKHAALERHQIKLNRDQQNLIEEINSLFDQNPFSPPDIKQILDMGDEEMLTYLLQQGIINQVSGMIVFKREHYEEMVETIRSVLEEKNDIRVADVRDLFNTSRKYALALMEHLDQIGMTKRVGDFRVLREG
jgi:selenocysteine-specific elongation factor